MTRLATIVILLSLVLGGCGAKQAPAPTIAPPPANAIALLPEDDGSVGRIAVSNQAGAVTLEAPNTITLVAAIDVAPAAPAQVDPAEITRRFGTALDAMPAAQAEFVLYFDLGDDRLTAQSQALVSSIMEAVAQRQSTDVSISGHTDTTGTMSSNYQLALRRAERVAEILVAQGLAATSLSVESHGEGNPLVRTADGVEEPRNRRVEVTVR
ncbi:MAG: OmpA family protein [Bryobacterales bacterium]|nr:OmpA family protein [Bryobacterales bacterium]